MEPAVALDTEDGGKNWKTRHYAIAQQMPICRALQWSFFSSYYMRLEGWNVVQQIAH